jgi:hypothetical protein
MNAAVLLSKNKCAKCTFVASELFAPANGSPPPRSGGGPKKEKYIHLLMLNQSPKEEHFSIIPINRLD